MGSSTIVTANTSTTTTYERLSKHLVATDDKEFRSDDNNNDVKKGLVAEDASTVEKRVIDTTDAETEEEASYNYFGFRISHKPKWQNIIGIIFIHSLFLYALITAENIPTNPLTYMWGFLMGGLGGFGVTGGAHRLWSHRAFKAKTPLRIILMLCFSLSGQNPLFDWVRDHRVHHKFSETDADPHNSNRGFFFAHMGWLMMNKHPEVLRKGKIMDMSDVTNDPVVKFHMKYFIPLKLVLCFFLPTFIPVYLWGESLYWAFISQCVIRYTMNLNFTWLVNSAAHMWGTKPYDNRINPVQNLTVSIIAMGEGWHNYHHVFPWDYRAAELGSKFNITAFWIDQFAKIGWAYDLKQPSADLLKNTILKHGDGSHETFGHHTSEVPCPADFNDGHKKVQ